jgi:four helix bundle protein
MNEPARDLKVRTKQFALRVIKLVNSLPQSLVAQTIAKQLIRSATSVAANYRAAARGRSKPEFRAKLGIVLEECDETCLWLELLEDAEIVSAPKLAPLRKEASELTAIMVASLNTSKGPR